MRLITEASHLVCAHPPGTVHNQPSQSLVRIDGERILVEPDPEGRTISGCPNAAIPSIPCTLTLAVSAGYSTLLTIDGRRVGLDTVTGFTNGTPPGAVPYTVFDAAQRLVESNA
jgi:hypothetical protein